MMNSRPKLEIPRTKLENVVRALSTVCTVGLDLYAVIVRRRLPEVVPTHFGVSGIPNAWGPKWILFLVPALATLAYLAMMLVERVPHAFNYPVQVTAANAPRLYLIARRWLGIIDLICVAAFGVAFLALVGSPLNAAKGLPGWYVLVVSGSLTLAAVAMVVSLLRAGARSSRES
ncbi:MAG: DUF1648 domain-containing protein [Polyangiaceae bacterium]|nr:DUF1648 domain-containing protein [Polyangiaceae bacterium]